MNKRFQVFISSTFRDLQEERKEAMTALLEMDCFPAGMELFPAANDDAWTLIKKVIDQSDYYILIISGVYGSTDVRGISYTEKEYDLALESKKPIMPFLHKDPGKIIAEKIEINSIAREKLELFRAKVEKEHHCKYWSTPEDLGGKISRSMNMSIRQIPAVGWVRADETATPEMLSEINSLRKQIAGLEKELDEVKISAPKDSDLLAQVKDVFEINYSLWWRKKRYGHDSYDIIDMGESSKTLNLTWEVIFHTVSGYVLAEERTDSTIKICIEKLIGSYCSIPDDVVLKDDIIKEHGIKINSSDFLTIKTQMMALGLLKKQKIITSKGKTKGKWVLTPYGENYLIKQNAVLRTA